MAIINKKGKEKKVEIPQVNPLLLKMKESLEETIADSIKFDGGTNTAGTRIRKTMQDIKIQTKESRDAVTVIRNARKEAR